MKVGWKSVPGGWAGVEEATFTKFCSCSWQNTTTASTTNTTTITSTNYNNNDNRMKFKNSNNWYRWNTCKPTCTWRDYNFFPRPRAKNVQLDRLNEARYRPDSERRVTWTWNHGERPFNVASQAYSSELTQTADKYQLFTGIYHKCDRYLTKTTRWTGETKSQEKSKLLLFFYRRYQ